MRVLISCKTTNLDLHGELIRSKITAGHLPAHHLRTLQEDHEQHHRCREQLLKLLKKHDISALEVRRGMYWPDMSQIDAVIAVGGDGTLLEASHHLTTSEIPLIGIRSSPKSVGYLCYRDTEGLDEMVEQLASNQLPTVCTPRLQAKIKRVESGFEKISVPILNDMLFTNSSPAATSRYRFTLGDTQEDHRSSGVWLSTPAGSTGAIHAAGGQAVSIRSERFQYYVRELHRIADGQKSFSHHGFFDPDTTKLRIENQCVTAILALDGHQGIVELGFGDVVSLQRATPLCLVSELP